MLNIFNGLFDTEGTTVISVQNFLICLATALGIGVILSLSYMYKSRYSSSFVITLAMLPAVVCVVIMLVNGNVGAGVAVAGAFSLVRFRSVPGTAKDITTLFLGMGAGLIAGMGYLAYAVLFTIIMCVIFILYNGLGFGIKRNAEKFKTFTITIPEDLDYTNIFEDIFEKYASSYSLLRVRTTNMGSMFKMTYDVTLKNYNVEKEMIDAIRCRNGNLEIAITKQESLSEL